MTENSTRIAAYFSHSYRSEDRKVNEFFWDLLWENGITVTVDPQSATFSVPYLEKMLKRSSCFVAVVTLRPKQEYYRCSPYILFEYGLAVQAQKPRLLFVESDVAEAYIPEQDCVCDFGRHSMREPRSVEKFKDKIKELAEKARAYGSIAIGRRKKVGLFFDANPQVDSAYTHGVSMVTNLLARFGYTPELLPLDIDKDYRFALRLDQFEFIIADVGRSNLPQWVYPFVYGRFIPSIKTIYLPSADRTSMSLSPLIEGQLIRGVGDTDSSVLFWRDEHELLSKVEEQLNKFGIPRTQFASREEGLGYFRSTGRAQRYVFISCAEDADDFTIPLSRRMRLENIPHFHYKASNPIERGQEWEPQFLNYIDRSHIFLALITKSYKDSQWCQKEFRRAEELQRLGKLRLIPYYLENVGDFPVATQGDSLTGITDQQKEDRIMHDLDKILTAPSTTIISSNVALPKDDSASVDIAIITILKEEYAAVRRHLSNPKPAPVTGNERDTFAWEVGSIESARYNHSFKVVLAMAGRAGTTSGFQATLATVERWNPRYALLVGIAGGRPIDQLKKGDVVVSDSIWLYEYGKIGDSGFEPRQDRTFMTSNSILTAAQSLDITEPWRNKLTLTPPEADISPELKVGSVASGDKVIDNVEDPFFSKVLEKWPKLIAVEMEGAGAASAIAALSDKGQSIGFTMIRGISDMPKEPQTTRLDGHISNQTQERDLWKKYASEVAACFAVQLISLRWPTPPKGSE